MTTERTLDWRPRFDPRSKNYPIRTLTTGKHYRSYTWGLPEGARLDQGYEGACTGFAFAHDLACRPGVIPAPEWLARSIYYRARHLDEWEGENYEGSSVLGAVKAVSELGVYGEYRWAFSVEELARAVGYVGPAVLGVNWYEGMNRPKKHGAISVSGKLLGGHAILCRGFHNGTGLFRLSNSWGTQWGFGGDCFLPWESMRHLIDEGAEVCVPAARRRLVA